MASMTVASSRGVATTIWRPGQADRQGGDGDEIEDGREVAAPGRPLRGDVGQQVQVREPDRVALAAALRPHVQAQEDRHEEQAEEEHGRRGRS